MRPTYRWEGAVNRAISAGSYLITACYKCGRQRVQGWYWIVTKFDGYSIVESKNLCRDCGKPMYEMQQLARVVNGE